MGTVKVVIKRNEDSNYDRLFRQVDSSSVLGRGQSVGERTTSEGYEVEFKYLDADVLGWLAARPRDFEVK
jgi:hypothetical protein